MLHPRITIAGSQLPAADIPNAGPMRGAYVTLLHDDDATAEPDFAALADGGQVFMPLAEIFFAARFAQLRDHFGINWTILHERPPRSLAARTACQMPPPSAGAHRTGGAMNSANSRAARKRAGGDERRGRANRVALAALVAGLLLSPLAAQSPKPGAHRSPCRSPLRFHRLCVLLHANNRGALLRAWASTCHAYPESVARAFRLHQLQPRGTAIPLLREIPRNFNQYAEISWAINAWDPQGTPVFALLRVPAPKPCPASERDYTTSGAFYTDVYPAWVRLAAAHPDYMPPLFGALNFFGYPNPPVDDAEGFPDLIHRLYQLNPAAFRREAKRSKYGRESLWQALHYPLP